MCDHGVTPCGDWYQVQVQFCAMRVLRSDNRLEALLWERASYVLRQHHDDLLVSKQRLHRTDSIQLVRFKRENGSQELAYSARPFVLCGLPVKRPPADTLIHERRNGRFLLQVTGHPHYGLPWGQDRLVPIFLATLATRQQSPRVTFPSAADMLDTFGMGQGGSQYRRLIAAFNGYSVRRSSSERRISSTQQRFSSRRVSTS